MIAYDRWNYKFDESRLSNQRVPETSIAMPRAFPVSLNLRVWMNDPKCVEVRPKA